MADDARWREYRLWYKAPPSADDLFKFKKEQLLPLLNRLGLTYSLILDQQQFVLVRVQIDLEAESRLQEELSGAGSKNGLFARVTVESWDPVDDARRRILDALERARKDAPVYTGKPLVGGTAGRGWKVAGRDASSGVWVVQDDNIDAKAIEFGQFMSRVAGEFTAAYIREMPRRIDDRWLMSLFLHLLLDSVSTHQGEE
jgi:hypothetical protein